MKLLSGFFESLGKMSLIRASQKGKVDNVINILNKGADIDINACDSNGNNALMLAAHNGHTEIVKLLLKAGADINKINNNGKTAVEIALENGNLEMAKLVLGTMWDNNILCDYAKINFMDPLLKIVEKCKKEKKGRDGIIESIIRDYEIAILESTFDRSVAEQKIALLKPMIESGVSGQLIDAIPKAREVLEKYDDVMIEIVNNSINIIKKLRQLFINDADIQKISLDSWENYRNENEGIVIEAYKNTIAKLENNINILNNKLSNLS